MSPPQRKRLLVFYLPAALGASAWACLLLTGDESGPAGFCSPASGVAPGWIGARFTLAALLLQPRAWIGGWALMLAAMMTPLLVSPLQHIHEQSLSRRRWRSAMLFLSAYCAAWLAPGLILAFGALLVRVPGSALPPVLPGLAIAVLWQASPAKQWFLNRCHRYPTLRAFGPAADLDVLRFGAAHGLLCAGTCWPLMMLPMLAPPQHGVMALAALWLYAERLEPYAKPRWSLRWPAKAARIVRAQIMSRLTTFSGSLARGEI